MGKRYSEKNSIFARGPHQTNYQTEAALTSTPPNYRLAVKNGYDKATFESPNVNNDGESTGLALPDRTYKSEDRTTFSSSEQLTYQLLGLLAFDAFGVSATPILKQAGVYEHNFSLLNPFVSPVLPSRPIASKINETAIASNRIYDARFPSMTINTFALDESGDKPNLVANTEYLGSGKMVEPSGVLFYGTGKNVVHGGEILTEIPINKRSGRVTIYPDAALGGTPIVTDCLVRGFTPTLNNNLFVNYQGCGLFQDANPLKGAIAGSADSGGQTMEIEFTLVADSDVLQSFNVHERLKLGTPFSLTNEYTGPVIAGLFEHKALFKLLKGVISSVSWVAVEGGGQGIRIAVETLATGNVTPFSLTLTSNVADFATYVGV